MFRFQIPQHQNDSLLNLLPVRVPTVAENNVQRLSAGEFLTDLLRLIPCTKQVEFLCTYKQIKLHCAAFLVAADHLAIAVLSHVKSSFENDNTHGCAWLTSIGTSPNAETCPRCCFDGEPIYLIVKGIAKKRLTAAS